MKKIFLILLALALTVGLFGCTNGPVNPEPAPPASETPTATVPVTSDPPAPEVTPTPEVTPSPGVSLPPSDAIAPAGTVLCGVELGGMNRDEALAALTSALSGYTHSVLVDGKTVTVSAQEAGLVLDEAQFGSFWQALEAGTQFTGNVLSLNSSALEQVLSAKLEVSAGNPYVVYISSQGQFVATPGSNGIDYDIPAVANWVAPSMRSLYASSSLDIDGISRVVAPAFGADSPTVVSAVEKANSYLGLTLVYAFTTENGGTISETFLKDTVAPMIRVDGNYNVTIDRSVVERKVSAVATRHSGPTRTEYFIATDGRTIPYAVTYYSRQVDVTAMTEDLYNCLVNGISGQRTAPYLSAEQTARPFGGSYVEIDLTAQTLWVYKDGRCVVTTPIVSGSVADNNHTPTGVYSIYKKAEDAWLVGPTWRDFVDYWMAFYGAYGLHDASWRDEFGGEIYINEGSHGCPNLPVEIAGQVYHNVSVGTPVVIYGGASTAYDLTQELTGTTVYNLSDVGSSFPLNVTAKYPEAVITYSSDNPAVATVDANGTVTVHGEGTANITVSAAAFTFHTAGTLTVQINVSATCQPGDHIFGSWVQDTIPNCEAEGSESRSCSVCGFIESRAIPKTDHSVDQWVESIAPACENPGSESGTCSVCGFVETREIPATGHDFSASSYVCNNGCGTANPDFFWPSW